MNYENSRWAAYPNGCEAFKCHIGEQSGMYAQEKRERVPNQPESRCKLLGHVTYQRIAPKPKYYCNQIMYNFMITDT